MTLASERSDAIAETVARIRRLEKDLGVTRTGVEAIQKALKLFGKSQSSNCSGWSKDGSGRPRGFTGTYDCTTRQHDWIELLRRYFSNGEQVRQWIEDDKKNGKTADEKTLLEKKYKWIEKNIFRGVEFKKDNEPLAAP